MFRLHQRIVLPVLFHCLAGASDACNQGEEGDKEEESKTAEEVEKKWMKE